MPTHSSGVTVIIPCYNQANYLAECLKSLLGQTYTDWTAVVVDDASTQGDVAAVVEAVKDPRIRVVRHPVNRGPAAARNTGFRLAQTPFVLPVDSDDYLAPTYLEKTVAALVSQPEVNCVFTHYRYFGDANGVYSYEVKGIPELLQVQWIPAAAMVRRTLWKKAGGYCEDDALCLGNEDWDFWLTVAEQGLHALCIPEPLYLYRKHSASMTVTTLNYHADVTWTHLYQRHRALYDAHGAGPKLVAEGYKRAARAAQARREWARAVAMWWRSIRVRWGGLPVTPPAPPPRTGT